MKPALSGVVNKGRRKNCSKNTAFRVIGYADACLVSCDMRKISVNDKISIETRKKRKDWL